VLPKADGHCWTSQQWHPILAKPLRQRRNGTKFHALIVANTPFVSNIHAPAQSNLMCAMPWAGHGRQPF
jgi:hypothetical protein